MDMITISAKTMDEAITKALLELKTTSEHLYYEVVQKESSGFLGIFGGKQCVIRARVMGEEEEKNKKAKAEAERKAKAEAEKAAKQAEEKARLDAEKAEKARAEAERKAKEEAAKAVQEKASEEKAVKKSAAPIPEKPAEKPQSQKKYSEQRDYEKKRYGKREGRADSHEKPERRNAEAATEKTEPKVRTEVKMDEAVVQAKAKEFLDQVFGAMGMQVVIETVVDAKEGELQVMMSGDDMGILIGKRGQTLDSLQYLVSLVVNKETEGYLRVKLDTENYRERRKETLETLAKNISYKVKRTKRPVSLEPMNPYERRIIHSALQNDRYVVTRSEGEDPYRHVVISLKRDGYNRRDRYPSRRDNRDRDGGSRDKRMEKPVIEKTEEGFE
ncbi:KH domain-containing protein [Clostridiaceae bacterium]|nr:KH domain-containing protein [Clostridiaceae bacterium]RKI16001.1 KH domain-containing protein [bacterium 1XD21-70]